MPGLTIGWEYLTGYAVATDPGNRQRAEWPPHPARVFMALAAAWFETGEDDTEGDALRWLETLDQPQLVLPPRERVVERSHVTVYVPVNDRAGPSAATLQSAPAMTRSKQPRAFPRVHIGDASCYLHWPTAEGVDDHHEALDRLCGKVTRIGHSSSFVRMWAAEETQRTDARGEHLVPDDKLAEHQARSIAPGMLKMLVGRFGEAARQKHAEMTDQVDALKGSKKAVKGKGSKERERKAGIDAKIRAVEEQLVRIVPRPPIRPTIGLWTGYRRVVDTAAKLDLARSHFDTDLLVLTRVDGPRLPVVSSLVLTCALRGAVMKHSGIQPVPAWVSGHEPDGSKCENDAGHLACIPLPFVGHDHADGHLLGVGLVFPRSVDRRQRGRVLGPLLVEEQTGEPCDVKLHLGRLGVSTLRKRAWSEMRDALQPEVWTAHPNGATTWASVTPVVLDRFPKGARRKDRAVWTAEVADIISEACVRIGLPTPANIDIDTTCWHHGGPRALAKRRMLRDRNGWDDGRAALGDGFPFYPAKGAGASRPQVHVWLEFAEPVLGPMLLGAGRYQGYGLCKPWNGWKEAGR